MQQLGHDDTSGGFPKNMRRNQRFMVYSLFHQIGYVVESLYRKVKPCSMAIPCDFLITRTTIDFVFVVRVTLMNHVFRCLFLNRRA